MSLQFDRQAPPTIQAASWLLLLRPPLSDEVPELQALLARLRQRWAWLAGGYLVFFVALVLPGLLRDRGAAYGTVAVVLPHLLLYVTLGSALQMWVGCRINLLNLPQVMRANQRRWTLAATGGVVAVVLLAAAALRGSHWDAAARSWLQDTLRPGAVAVLLLALLVGLPELVARLRGRQQDLSLQLLKAQATQERLARVTAESEMRLLQAQVEPHFLYNTLANLRFLVQSGSPDALRMTDALIDYLRTSVPDMRAQQVALGREVDHARHYLDIMQMRMAGRLRYTIDVPPPLREVALPPLVLLTLVENAVKHGIAPQVEGGSISLRARAEGDRVVVTVEDDGAGLSDAAAAVESPAGSGGTGLANVRARLALVYDEEAELRLTAAVPRGTRATLRLPLTGPLARPAFLEVVVVVEEKRMDATAAPATPAAPKSPAPAPTKGPA
ncbi:MAG: sensor histidine kinase [Betaproteobacteria bacterium]|jgi:signal transduction histidine kinase|nr:histidine kinase [Rubrivivax sp.]